MAMAKLEKFLRTAPSTFITLWRCEPLRRAFASKPLPNSEKPAETNAEKPVETNAEKPAETNAEKPAYEKSPKTLTIINTATALTRFGPVKIERVFICPICDSDEASFQHPNTMSAHFHSKHPKTAKKGIKCPKCLIYFDRDKDLNAHEAVCVVGNETVPAFLSRLYEEARAERARMFEVEEAKKRDEASATNHEESGGTSTTANSPSGTTANSPTGTTANSPTGNTANSPTGKKRGGKKRRGSKK